MKIVVVVQARTGSTRLPNKILLDVHGKPLLQRMLERVQLAKTQFDLIVATTNDPSDDPVRALALKLKIPCYSGHPTDLLDRHFRAAEARGATVVVKIPSDVPLIDPRVIDRVLRFYLEHELEYDFVSNLHPATYPDGNDVEVMPMRVLAEAHQEANKPHEREHTTPFLWDQPGRYRIGNVAWEGGKDLSMSHRFTIDYEEDYEFIKAVFEELHDEQRPFSVEDVVQLLERKPDIYQINAKYAGVNWYRNHLDDLKTVGAENTRSV